MACAVILAKGPGTATAAYPSIRQLFVALFRFLLVPSMVVCVFSGFASMMVHRPYWNALWAWLKGGTSILLLTITFRGQGQALSVLDADVFGDPAQLADVLRKERSGLWILLAVALFNVVIGIWRPRFSGMKRKVM
jgi:hypothetical protein